MSTLTCIRQTTKSCYVSPKPKLRNSLRAFHSVSSRLLNNELTDYHNVIKNSDREKVRKIANMFLPESDRKKFLSLNAQVEQKELIELIDKIETTVNIPMEYLYLPNQQSEVEHFQNNRTFINLPYSEKVSKWADRTALQSLIRNKFKTLFENGDLVLVPGCADGQIPIEIHAHAVLHEMELDIIAADVNETAMKLGYCTMKSFGLDSDRIRWVQADVNSPSFFQWVSRHLSTRSRHQIVTLIQPSLREEALISFLTKISDLAHTAQKPTNLIMPILLEDHETKWYKDYGKQIEQSLDLAKKTKDTPQLIWQKTKYGKEVLKLNTKKDAYVPQQYFIHPEAIPEIQRITGYSEAAQKVFGALPKLGISYLAEDPRLIESKYSKRIFCVWEVKKN